MDTQTLLIIILVVLLLGAAVSGLAGAAKSKKANNTIKGKLSYAYCTYVCSNARVCGSGLLPPLSTRRRRTHWSGTVFHWFPTDKAVWMLIGGVVMGVGGLARPDTWHQEDVNGCFIIPWFFCWLRF
jgi:hypothetical protein